MIHPSQLSSLIWTVATLVGIAFVPWGRLHFYWQEELRSRFVARRFPYVSYDIYWMFLLFLGGVYASWWGIFMHNTVSDDWRTLNIFFTIVVLALMAYHNHAYMAPMHFGMFGPLASFIFVFILCQFAFTIKYEQAHTPPGSDLPMDAIACIAAATLLALVWTIYNWLITISSCTHWEEMYNNVRRATEMSIKKPLPASTTTDTPQRTNAPLPMNRPFITFPHTE